MGDRTAKEEPQSKARGTDREREVNQKSSLCACGFVVLFMAVHSVVGAAG